MRGQALFEDILFAYALPPNYLWFSHLIVVSYMPILVKKESIKISKF